MRKPAVQGLNQYLEIYFYLKRQRSLPLPVLNLVNGESIIGQRMRLSLSPGSCPAAWSETSSKKLRLNHFAPDDHSSWSPASVKCTRTNQVRTSWSRGCCTSRRGLAWIRPSPRRGRQWTVELLSRATGDFHNVWLEWPVETARLTAKLACGQNTRLLNRY